MSGPRRRRSIWRWAVVALAVVVVVTAVAYPAWRHAQRHDDAQGQPARSAASAAPSAAGAPSASQAPAGVSTSASPTGAPEGTVTQPAPAEVRVEDYTELPPEPLTATVEYGTAVSARLVGIARIDAVGREIGERSGPALAVTVEITNTGATAVPLDVVVNVYDSEGRPAATISSDSHNAPLPEQVAAGDKVTGTYVLRPPTGTADGDVLKVTVSYAPLVPAAAFQGVVGS